MLDKIKKKIESKRNSENIFWAGFIFLKDFIFWNSSYIVNFFQSNLSFMVYSLFLSNNLKNCTKIIHKILDGKTDRKVNLMDVTFLIPARYDSVERKKNIECVIKYLKTFFDTNIILGEEDKEKHFEYLSQDVQYMFFSSNNDLFHKTKVLNLMAKAVKTEFIASYDADVLINPNDIIYALDMLKNGCNVVYPFNGRFLYVKSEKSEKIKDNIVKNDFDIKTKNGDYYKTNYNSPGGAYIIRKKDLIRAGMDNENFISWGGEDWERDKRFMKLGFKIKKTFHPLFHLYHPRGNNSSRSNNHYEINQKEYEKVSKMTKEQIQEYIKTWKWLENA